MLAIFARFILVLAFCGLYACSSLMPRSAQEVWIDVRLVAEHEASSIPGHANIPHTEIGDSIMQLVTDKNAAVFLYCGSGHRAGVAKENTGKLRLYQCDQFRRYR